MKAVFIKGRTMFPKGGMKRTVIFLVIIALLYGCAIFPQREEYYNALKQGRYADAYEILKDLCNRTPSYYLCKDLEDVATKYAGQRLEALKGAIKSTPEPVPIDKLAEFEKKLEEVLKISPSLDVTEVKNLIEKKRAATIEAVKSLVEQAYQKGAARRLKEALALLQKASRLDPTKKELLREYRQKSLARLYSEGERAKAEQRWRVAHRVFSIIYDVDPSYRDVAKELSLAKSKDTYGYHIEEAKKAYRNKDYQRAVRFAELALTYDNTKQARELLYAIITEKVRGLFEKGVELYQEDLLLSAGATLLDAITLLKRLPYEKRKEVAVPSGTIKRVVDEMVVRAKEEWQKGEREIAYLYVDIVSRIEPHYPDIVILKDGWEEEVERFSLPTLAVIPFRGPSYNVDAGGMISTRILHYVYNELARDVKILERSAMEAIIKEKEVKALQSGELRGDILKLIGADYLIIGNVTDYRVENSVINNFKILMAKVGTRKILNPEYEEWIAKGRTGDEPPKYIDEPLFEKVRYRVSHHKKIANVSVGWRVVDSNGNIIYVDVVEKNRAETSEGREGVSIGDITIEEKLPSLPTDSELLKSVEDDVVQEIGEKLKTLFSSSERQLLQKARRLEERGNLRKALSELVRARFIAENKGVDTTPIKAEMQKILAEGVI